MENATLEHVVNIDEQLQVKVQVPEEMEVSEFRDLLKRVEKLCEMKNEKSADTTEKKSILKRLEPEELPKKPVDSTGGGVSTVKNLTEEQKDFLNRGKYSKLKRYIIKHYRHKTAKEIAEMFGVKTWTVFEQAKQLRNKGIKL